MNIGDLSEPQLWNLCIEMNKSQIKMDNEEIPELLAKIENIKLLLNKEIASNSKIINDVCEITQTNKMLKLSAQLAETEGKLDICLNRIEGSQVCLRFYKTLSAYASNK